jgi:hypothetical protein
MQIKSDFKRHLNNLIHILDLHLARTILPNPINIILFIEANNVEIIHGDYLTIIHIDHPLIIYQIIS